MLLLKKYGAKLCQVEEEKRSALVMSEQAVAAPSRPSSVTQAHLV